jgi:hypothetical protein
MNFIKTNDEELAKNLRLSGYKELKKQGKFFVFLNNGKLKFTEEQEQKMIRTNKMEV